MKHLKNLKESIGLPNFDKSQEMIYDLKLYEIYVYHFLYIIFETSIQARTSFSQYSLISSILPE
jgi:hypothetical protein